MLTLRDSQRLNGVHPVLVAAIEDIFTAMHDRGTPMFVVSGVRTTEEQQRLYAQGRGGIPGRRVTYKDGVTQKSDHQVEGDGFGHAVDCAFLPTKDIPDAWSARWPWSVFGDLVERVGMQWGGRFKQPIDLDHVQYVVPTVRPTAPPTTKLV